MGLFLLCISGLFFQFGSIRTEPGVEGATMYSKEADVLPYRSFVPRERELNVFEDQPNRFYPMDGFIQQNQPDGIFMRPAFAKRGDKGILLDVGDYVMNGGPHSGDMKDLLKSPNILRVGGMMRNSG